MTVDEAIQLLTKDVEEGYYEAESPVEEAAKLGIEALKELKIIRESYPSKHFLKLPGETEE